MSQAGSWNIFKIHSYRWSIPRNVINLDVVPGMFCFLCLMIIFWIAIINIRLGTFLVRSPHWLIEIIRVFFLLTSTIFFFLIVGLIHYFWRCFSWNRFLILLRSCNFKFFVWIFIIIFLILTFIILLLMGCNRLLFILIYRIYQISSRWFLFNWHRRSERLNARL